MLALTILMEGDGMLKDIPEEKIVHVVQPITVAALDQGMTSGKPSVAIAIPLEDGRIVLAETSMRLFLAAARAFRTRYGDLG